MCHGVGDNNGLHTEPFLGRALMLCFLYGPGEPGRYHAPLRTTMNDHDAGYRVFVRTIVGLTGTVCALAAMMHAFGASMFGGSIFDLSNRLQLSFWLLLFAAIYCVGAFICGRFAWLLGNPITIQSLFIVTLVIGMVLAFLSPLIHNL